MSGNARILNSGQKTFFREHVTVANATGLQFDAHFSRTGLRNLALDELEISSGLGDLGHLHLCHLWYYWYFHRCHKSSLNASVSVGRALAEFAFNETQRSEGSESLLRTLPNLCGHPNRWSPSRVMVDSQIACGRADR